MNFISLRAIVSRQKLRCQILCHMCDARAFCSRRVPSSAQFPSRPRPRFLLLTYKVMTYHGFKEAEDDGWHVRDYQYVLCTNEHARPRSARVKKYNARRGYLIARRPRVQPNTCCQGYQFPLQPSGRCGIWPKNPRAMHQARSTRPEDPRTWHEMVGS